MRERGEFEPPLFSAHILMFCQQRRLSYCVQIYLTRKHISIKIRIIAAQISFVSEISAESSLVNDRLLPTTSCYQVQTETEFIRLTVSLRSYLKVFTRIHKKNSQKKFFLVVENFFSTLQIFSLLSKLIFTRS